MQASNIIQITSEGQFKDINFYVVFQEPPEFIGDEKPWVTVLSLLCTDRVNSTSTTSTRLFAYTTTAPLGI
jgi:hypothetical protein